LSEAVPFFFHIADLRLPEAKKDALNPIWMLLPNKHPFWI
jgi:hypothetical protein